jgi:hypothetical protein
MSGCVLPPSKTQVAGIDGTHSHVDEGTSPDCMEPRGVNSQPSVLAPLVPIALPGHLASQPSPLLDTRPPGR